ncbi:UDP-glucose 4-epimerase GalE [Allopusillimonas soli]|uniref:UDP-glucose 4-epimerase n=1 Tax=Allopusillimonas soli TaxID=659016 RepID=A0A853FD63_9BURK|nr:UDP-glucose 4-epimerase GalE [Allopusillimonas soli]NYT38013.1 UDP-glucose 4-epimerase GalE [Allopusillimonas soli]TEA73906.1 UDP-glucose 4-epimerase GalE [Allopusillimonas soli]
MQNNKTVLVTGGTGYIGSHAVVELIESGYRVIVLDNLSNSRDTVIDSIFTITGVVPEFILGDIRNGALLDSVFKSHSIDAVMHFAGLKAVGESTEIPLAYYDNNVNGTIQILNAMKAAGVRSFIFSSSATVYGHPEWLPLTESHPRRATNPYGNTKLMVEGILEDLAACDNEWRIACLRYFNPVGAHGTGLIGESPAGLPNNLMPYVAQVASGRRPTLYVFGNDYDTADGTGVRDYVHVVDLAKGHVNALAYCERNAGRMLAVNLGTGVGYSVLEMIQAFEQVSGKPVPYKVVSRREGDVAACWADVALAESLLKWKAERGVRQMCEDAWRWERNFEN